LALDVTIVGKSDLDKLANAFDGLAGNARVYALQGSQTVALAVTAVGEANLDKRAGGGRYMRSVAEVVAVEAANGWGAALITPWLGMEFGGFVTMLWGNAFGTGWDFPGGESSRMWAPWHSTSEEGYIIGAAWTELERGASVDDALAAAMVAGIDMEMDKAGVPKK